MPKRLTALLHRLLAAALAATAIGSGQAATLYRWIDAQGVTHWSDRPVEGSVAVELGAPSSINPPVPAGRASPQSASTTHPVIYSTIEIVQPTDGASLFDSGGSVECIAQLTPTLAPGHTIWFQLDGQRVDAHGATTLSLNAPRGTHELKVIVLNAEGQQQASSSAITFFVKQASRLTPPVGPLLKMPR